eukprot:scaffold331492_cov49-Prasinocladus_malaysianus.AAC.1
MNVARIISLRRMIWTPGRRIQFSRARTSADTVSFCQLSSVKRRALDSVLVLVLVVPVRPLATQYSYSCSNYL